VPSLRRGLTELFAEVRPLAPSGDPFRRIYRAFTRLDLFEYVKGAGVELKLRAEIGELHAIDMSGTPPCPPNPVR
jgi:hypothetical protein